ncbi:MAG: histidine kinase [Bacteroidia bacterium]
MLYVDDEKQNLIAFKAAFRMHYQVHIAGSGGEALEILSNNQVDIVVTDQRMPEMTGVQLLMQVRDHYPNTIRMVLTGFSDMAAIVDAINKGSIYYYISKPWKEDELKLVFDKALENKRLRADNEVLMEAHTELLLKTEQQEKAHLLSQYNSLKEQLNPHFLFNCLNALATLVHEDPEIADTFISRMTRVYRYLLEQQQEPLVPLDQELRVLNDYMYLQQVRFGENLKLEVDIPPQYLSQKLPPLTLQLLAENAIKHNVISVSRPLNISVKLNEAGEIEMRNTLQLRQDKPPSTKIGQKNLIQRYELLADRIPRFYEAESEFVATAPLVATAGFQDFSDSL